LFKGKEIYLLDAKGRVSIPARLRKHISSDANDSFVMTQGIGPCIYIYPLDHWQQIEERLSKLNPFNPKEALFKRLFLHLTADATLDSQSRIIIPKNLLEYAKIEKEVLILGQVKNIELWDPKIFNDYLNQAPLTYEQVAEQVAQEVMAR